MLRRLLFAFALLFAAPAHAEWHEATSRNFVVYSQGSAEDARSFAAKLEQFNHVLRALHNIRTPESSIRLRVFLLPTLNAVGRMAGGAGVAGYYIPDARGLMLVGTRARNTRRSADVRTARADIDIDAESILLHEYTHHFMFQYFPATYPTWYQEGFAEFWGATRFLPNNVVEVGRPVDYRFSSINPFLGFMNMSRWLPVGDMLRAQSYADVPELDLLYAEGWMLVRYAFQNPERNRQLQRYLTLINNGRPYGEAATEAFGDLGRLNDELFAYAGRRRFDVVQLPFRELPTGEITLREMRPAEQALLEYEIRLAQGGIYAREIADFAAEVRPVAARFPDDPFALALRTEVERLAGDGAAAQTAARRWAEVAPTDGRALMFQGLLQVDALRAARSTDTEAWNAARRLIVQANRLTPNNPLILQAYYDSYVAQQVQPPEAAQNALYTAMELAPSDDELRYKVALDFERRNMIPEAIAIIRPDALRLPHRNDESEGERRRRETQEERYRQAGRERRESAREMLVRLEARQNGQPAAAQRQAASN